MGPADNRIISITLNDWDDVSTIRQPANNVLLPNFAGSLFHDFDETVFPGVLIFAISIGNYEKRHIKK